MKIILALCAVLAVIGAAVFYRSTQMPNTYGQFTNAAKVSIAAVLKDPQAFEHQTIALEGEITKQCESMGCYFYFRSGHDELRIDLAEIAMNAPKKKNGHKARVEGRTVPFNGGGWQLWASAVEFE